MKITVRKRFIILLAVMAAVIACILLGVYILQTKGKVLGKIDASVKRVADKSEIVLGNPSKNHVDPPSPPSGSDWTAYDSERPAVINDLVFKALERIDNQNEVDRYLMDELDSGIYTFDDPLIVVDPYGCSPLTALALFTSENPLNISIHIEGRTKLADVDFTFDSYNTRHMVPIYGLYADKQNEVVLTARFENGSEMQSVLEVQTEPIPNEMGKITIQTNLPMPDKYQNGFNYLYEKTCAFDVNGDYRWYLQGYNTLLSKTYEYFGNMVVAEGSVLFGDVVFYDMNSIGRICNVYYSPYGVHHDIYPINNGNLLVTGSNGDMEEDFIYEINVIDGTIVNTIDLKNVLQRTRRNLRETYGSNDWFHTNAIVYKDGKIIISGRNQSSVVKMSWPDGKIDWILSTHDGWLPMFQKYLLNPIGKNFEWQYGQHNPVILTDFDNNSDTIDILLFDNGNERLLFDKNLQHQIKSNEIISPENYSRMVQYRINEKTMTVEQIWQFGKELGEINFSDARGSSQYLANNNRLGLFNLGSYSSSCFEVSEKSEIVWEARTESKNIIDPHHDYRATRLPIYNASANNLRIGDPVNNLIPKELLPPIAREYNTPINPEEVACEINLRMNGEHEILITITNLSEYDLFPGGNTPVNISYHIYFEDGTFIRDHRMSLGKYGLLKGETKEYKLDITKLSLPIEKYYFYFSLVQDGVTSWFRPVEEAKILVRVLK